MIMDMWYEIAARYDDGSTGHLLIDLCNVVAVARQNETISFLLRDKNHPVIIECMCSESAEMHMRRIAFRIIPGKVPNVE